MDVNFHKPEGRDCKRYADLRYVLCSSRSAMLKQARKEAWYDGL